MARRNTELFNLSFLDLLSGALGAVIFLFIITPKGGQGAAATPQVVLSIDTTYRQIFGTLPDSLFHKDVGDTLLVLITDFEKMPSIEDCPTCPPPVSCPDCPVCPQIIADNSTQSNNKAPRSFNTSPSRSKPPSTKKVADKNMEGAGKMQSGYKGDPPSVPCEVSFEIAWDSLQNNVDLYVCREGRCVFGQGRNRRNNNIGQWDSGKSKNKIFGDDLRTTMEAVRQFDRVIPGTYQLFAKFKESANGSTSVNIRGLIYSKGTNSKEQGERFSVQLPLNEKERTALGTVELKQDGSFTFTKN